MYYTLFDYPTLVLFEKKFSHQKRTIRRYTYSISKVEGAEVLNSRQNMEQFKTFSYHF